MLLCRLEKRRRLGFLRPAKCRNSALQCVGQGNMTYELHVALWSAEYYLQGIK